MINQFYFKQFNSAKSFVCTQFKCQSSIWPIDKTLSHTTSLSESEPGRDGNEGVLCIPQNSSAIGDSPSDCVMPYPENLLVSITPLQIYSRCIL